jgi:hypothetical protein
VKKRWGYVQAIASMTYTGYMAECTDEDVMWDS